jgi:hypothetical protein
MLTAASGRDLSTAGDMAAVLAGGSQSSRLPTQVRCPGSRAFHQTLQDHPVWGDYLAKRSQLVVDLADQVQAHACRGDAEPAWAPQGSHPSTDLLPPGPKRP